jgi:release factor glutamine methyltransferase
MQFLGLDLILVPTVYAPAEDSFMLAHEAAKLHGRVLEIGCGSGIVSLVCAKAGCEVLGVDINPDAVACSMENAKRNRVSNASFIESNLFSDIPKDGEKFDAIIFNPPYLPTSKSEKLSNNKLNHAFDGGKTGRTVLDRFLDEFSDFLEPDGVLLLVQSSLNDEEKTIKKLEAFGYAVKIVAEEKFFFEKLSLIRAKKE